MISSINDILNFLNDKSFKKIFVICGKKSFKISGAQVFLDKIDRNKEIRSFFKNSELPIIEELVKIINDIKNFAPDLILAVGGGTVIDYAKIANIADNRSDLADLIVN